VTVADVFEGLHRALRPPVTAAEFELIPSERAKHAIGDAFLRRCKRQLNFATQCSEEKSGIRRIDFLRDMSEFGGLVYSKEGWILNVS